MNKKIKRIIIISTILVMTIVNVVLAGSTKITIVNLDKKNEENKISGSVFQIYDEEGILIDEVTTNENGEAVSTKVFTGQWYTIQQVSTDENYILDNIPQKTIVVVKDKIVVLRFYNEEKEIEEVEEKPEISEDPVEIEEIIEEENLVINTEEVLIEFSKDIPEVIKFTENKKLPVTGC